MKKFTSWQKFMMLGGIAGAGLAFSIMYTSGSIGFKNADIILKLASELGPDKAINLLKESIDTKVIQFPAINIAS